MSAFRHSPDENASGNLSTQTGPFSSAIIYARNYFDLASGEAFPSVEYLNTHAVKKLCWGIKEIVEWLLDSDIHFILNHVHQGNEYIHSRKHVKYYLNSLRKLFEFSIV